MSKPVRLPSYLYDELQKLAAQEKRSLANMVAVLLDQALKMENMPITREDVQMDGLVRTQTSTTPRVERRREAAAQTDDDHFKPDFK